MATAEQKGELQNTLKLADSLMYRDKMERKQRQLDKQTPNQ